MKLRLLLLSAAALVANHASALVSEPDVVDMVVLKNAEKQAWLIMIEDRKYDGSAVLQVQLQKKINAYLRYSQSQLDTDYPKAKGLPRVFILASAFEPDAAMQLQIKRLQTLLKERDIEFRHEAIAK